MSDVLPALMELCAAAGEPGLAATELAGRLGAYHADAASPPTLYVEPFPAWLRAAMVATNADGTVANVRLEVDGDSAPTEAELVSAFGPGEPARRASPGRTVAFSGPASHVFADFGAGGPAGVITLRPARS